jgi:4-alpha-glucanotransferase
MPDHRGSVGRQSPTIDQNLPMRRSAGVLLHPTSLPGPYPIGDIGPAADRWIEWLTAAGVSWWQVLPLNPPGYGASPYQAFSAFAGNTMLISPDLLVDDGIIDSVPEAISPAGRVDFAAAEAWKRSLVDIAADRIRADAHVDTFRTANASWVEDYAVFMALKAAHGGRSFIEWPDELRRREPSALARAASELADVVDREIAAQYLFFRQWQRLREVAASAGIGIIGDAPIFVAEDSADVWTRPELFELDVDLRPTVVAGVPPDYFSETGQLWGNPLYRWEAHAAEGYAWWIARLRAVLDTADLARIDHFRGFADYWEIPAGSATAQNGRWVLGPGTDFFDAVRGGLGGLPFIAEDLGEIHDVVEELRLAVGLPGMQVGQFAFTPDQKPPGLWSEDTIGYTGTHDNDTTVGWWNSIGPDERERANLLGGIGDAHPALDLIRAVWESPSVVAVTPIQDLLELDTEARMNAPGTLGSHNWTWRLDAMPSAQNADWLRDITIGSRRAGPTMNGQ